MNDIEKLANSTNETELIGNIKPYMLSNGNLEQLADALKELFTNGEIDESVAEKLFNQLVSAKQKEKPYIYESKGMKKVNNMKLADYISDFEEYKTVERSIEDKDPEFYFYDDANGYYKRYSKNKVLERISYYITKCGEDIEYKTSMAEEVYKQLCQKDDHSILPEKFYPDENVINFEDGVLHLDTMELTQHLPGYKFTNQIPCKWNDANKETPVFSAFLDKLADGDQETKTLLLQFLGLMVSNINATRYKTSLYLFGLGDTGKSQYFHIASSLVGEKNYYAIDLPGLEKDEFSLMDILGKRLIGHSDSKTAYINELGNFKAITGGDILSIRRKHSGRIQGKYTGAVLFCSNQLAHFGGDLGQWVYDRFIPVECNNVIPKNERDPNLFKKIYKERSGIVALALQELKKMLDGDDHLTVPKKSALILEQYKITNNPVVAFFTECCEMRTGERLSYRDNVTRGVVYEVYKNWLNKYYPQLKPLAMRTFNKNIALHLGISQDSIIVDKENRTKLYYTFTLNKATQRCFSIREYP